MEKKTNCAGITSCEQEMSGPERTATTHSYRTHLALEILQRLIQIFDLLNACHGQHDDEDPCNGISKGLYKDGGEEAGEGFGGEDSEAAEQRAARDEAVISLIVK